MECAQYQFQNNNNRKLDQAEEVEYFMGPYCADNGGAIYLGLFTDDQCTIFADDYGGKETYYTNSYGQTMPFHATSVIDYDCISCKEPVEDDENNGGDDAQDADEVIDFCEQIYTQAGKCEIWTLLVWYFRPLTRTHATTWRESRLYARMVSSNRTRPRPTRLPPSLLVSLLSHSSSSPPTSTTSRPSSTAHPSTLLSKHNV